MRVTEKGDMFHCDCGFSWRRGHSGSHDCEKRLRAQRDELLAALESLVLFTNPKPSNAVALNNAYQVIARTKGGAA